MERFSAALTFLPDDDMAKIRCMYCFSYDRPWTTVRNPLGRDKAGDLYFSINASKLNDFHFAEALISFHCSIDTTYN